MSDLALHIWRGAWDEDPPDLFRMEFQSIKSGDSFFFDLTPESLRRMLEAVINFAETASPGGYGFYCFDLSEEGDDEKE